MSIEAIAIAVPSQHQTAQEIALLTGADPSFISEKVGLKGRYILGPEESGVQLSTAACNSLYNRHPELASQIDLLVCVTQTPDQRIPHNSALIAHELGLPKHVAAFDISLGCSGYVYALTIVEGFLQSCGMQNALLVTCDPYSRIMAAEDKDTNCVFGDAATATWIKCSPGRSKTLSTVFGTDGSGSKAIEIRAGGAMRPFVSALSTETHSYDREDLQLRMQGRNVFNFVMSFIPNCIGECLDKANLSLNDIDYFALHQGSIYMLDTLANRVGIPQSKLLKNMDRYGNTVSSSIPLLLAELDQNNKLAGSTILMAGFGVGLSWSIAILRFLP